jgi:hypothetical protein
VRRIAVVVLGAVLLGWAAGASSARSDRPTLRLRGTEPLSLAGSRFVARERVRVTVIVPGEQAAARRVTASRRGSFTVTFPSVDYDRCNSLFGRAVGSEGSRAALKLPAPQCPPRP